MGSGIGVDINSIGREFFVGERGGEYKKTLSLQNMPKHDHSNGAFKHVLMNDGTITTGSPTDTTVGEPNVASSRPMLEQGGSQPFDAMIPYVVLKLCYTQYWKEII